jgi:transposase
MAVPDRPVIVGVDTHADTHTAVALDDLGRHLDKIEIPATKAGYRKLLRWARKLGTFTQAGVEGTGAYGAGLTRYLTDAGIAVIEVTRPNRQHRRRHGKSDPADAYAAAKAVLSGEATGEAKRMKGQIEIVRQLHLVRRSAVKTTTMTSNQINALIVNAPDEVQTELRGLTTRQQIVLASTWPTDDFTTPETATRSVIATLANRHQQLRTEITTLERQLSPLIKNLVPTLLAEHGVGLDVASRLLITVGENPDRIRNEASFAALCGVSPVDASSGKQQHHRLNRGGDRQANNALHTVWLTRARTCPETRAYITKQTTNGRTRRHTSRCIKRTLARRFHQILKHDLQHLT